VLKRKILVGTFHKSGTKLMEAVWHQVCTEHKLVVRHKSLHPNNPPEGWQVCLEHHSRLEPELQAGNCRVVFVIRDPRDLVINGAHCHAWSEEKWLHTPRPDFGGLSCHQKINSLPEGEERYLFEMSGVGGHTIRDMLSVVSKLGPESYLARLETLTTDYDLTEFHRIFSFLGFGGDMIPSLLSIAYRNSIFSGQVGPSRHIRSGKPAQWKTHFTPRVLHAFMRQFPHAPERLGYEPSSEAALACNTGAAAKHQEPVA